MNASLAHGSAVSDVPLVPGEQPPADSIFPASGSVSGTCPDYPPITKDLIDALKQFHNAIMMDFTSRRTLSLGATKLRWR